MQHFSTGYPPPRHRRVGPRGAKALRLARFEELPMLYVEILIVLALILLNGFFAMSELAVVSARKSRLKAMARAGVPGARSALALAEEPGTFLPTVQIGITLIGILA